MRTPTKEVVKKIAKILRDECPDYIYLRDLFKKCEKSSALQLKLKTNDYHTFRQKKN